MGTVKRPNKSECGPFTYRVEWIDSIFLGDNDEVLQGQCSHNGQFIKVATVMDPMRQRFVALHEVVHQINETYPGIKLPDDQVDAFAIGLLDWMRRNPEFVAWLMGKDEG